MVLTGKLVSTPLGSALVALGLFAGSLLATPSPARAAEPVRLALVLLTDVSHSVDAEEFALIKNGYRKAFSDPDVIDTIEASGGIAVTYVEFSDRHNIRVVHDWRVLRTGADAIAYGLAIEASARTSSGNTAMAAGLSEATRLLTEGQFGDARLVIDVVSDMTRDGGRARRSRDASVAAGITINGLPIIEQIPFGTIDGRLAYDSYSTPGGIVGFFKREIIGGNGAFIVEARSYADFADALRLKLLRELMVAQN